MQNVDPKPLAPQCALRPIQTLKKTGETFFASSLRCFFAFYLLDTMGKVHGSLARAGKVKGQTPKVEAQEDKKKQPRGRAKKRLQYNRRYVNVVTGMGGKRVGPNSNADKMK